MRVNLCRYIICKQLHGPPTYFKQNDAFIWMQTAVDDLKCCKRAVPINQMLLSAGAAEQFEGGEMKCFGHAPLGKFNSLHALD